ncbi:MAG: pyridoxal phosphate-dependent aminotransferase [bacterium]
MFNKNVLSEELSLIRKYTTEIKKYEDGISFAIGEPYLKVHEDVINETKRCLDNLECGYTSAQGQKELIDAICIKENVLSENVLVTSGSSEGIFISLLSLLNKDDEVIIITPCYPQYSPVVSFCNGVVKYVDTSKTNYVPKIDSIKEVVNDKTKIIIINSPSNPTGVTYDISTLNMINNLCKDHNIIVICDDVYEYITYKEKEKFSFDLDYSVTLKSFSKTYGMTGYRLGYLITSNKILKQLLKVHSYLSISLPIFIQKAGVKALQLPNNSYQYFTNNLSIVKSFLEVEEIEYIDVSGGIFIFINIEKYGTSDSEFCTRLLHEFHVACVPGNCFLAPGYIRLNFAVKTEDLITGLERIKCFIKTLKKD